ncbi:Autophagy protein 22 [Aspergillus nanangensis]|uniref:Autophagy protein 22 n=1 Tax=Aspergillus nanangensis TaxID=2582783 RepID=A0AAD4CQ31_ASPNN|nr:Autophagy protein 22 [Aspergillus nanangensis]
MGPPLDGAEHWPSLSSAKVPQSVPLSNMISTIQELIDPHFDPASIGGEILLKCFKPISKSIPPEDLEFLHFKGALQIPADPLRVDLLRYFVQYVHPSLPILDITRLQDVGYATRSEARTEFYNRVRLLYSLSDEEDGLVKIQVALLMMHQQEHNTHPQTTMRFWLEVCWSHANDLRLHLDPATLNLDHQTQSLRIRLWWSLYSMDRIIKLTHTHLSPSDSSMNRVPVAGIPMPRIQDFTLTAPSSSTAEIIGCTKMDDYQNPIIVVFLAKVKLCEAISLYLEFIDMTHRAHASFCLASYVGSVEEIYFPTILNMMDEWKHDNDMLRPLFIRVKGACPQAHLHFDMVYVLYFFMVLSLESHVMDGLAQFSMPSSEGELQSRFAAQEISRVILSSYAADTIRFLGPLDITLLSSLFGPFQGNRKYHMDISDVDNPTTFFDTHPQVLDAMATTYPNLRSLVSIPDNHESHMSQSPMWRLPRGQDIFHLPGDLERDLGLERSKAEVVNIFAVDFSCPVFRRGIGKHSTSIANNRLPNSIESDDASRCKSLEELRQLSSCQATGYRDEWELVYHDQTRRTIERSMQKRVQPAISISTNPPCKSDAGSSCWTNPLSVSVDDAGINYFLHHFVIGGPSPSRGYLNCVPAVYSAEGEHPTLVASMAAVGLAALASSTKQPEFAKHARAKYWEAIASINAALASPVDSGKDSILMSVISLGLFEHVSKFEVWFRHIQGATSLLVSRGTSQFSRPASLLMFNQVRADMTAACIHSLQRVPNDILQLQEEATKYANTSSGFWLLGVLATRCANLLADVTNDASTTLEDFLDEAIILQRDFQSVLAIFVAEEPYRTTRDSSADPNIVYNHRIDIYGTIWAIRMWNNSRSLQIVVCEVVFHLLNKILAKRLAPPRRAQLEMKLRETLQIMSQLGDDILATVPQVLGHVSSTSERFLDVSADPSVSEGHLLTWCLYTVGKSPVSTSETRKWVMRHLQNIGENAGIGMALQFVQDVNEIDKLAGQL